PASKSRGRPFPTRRSSDLGGQARAGVDLAEACCIGIAGLPFRQDRHESVQMSAGGNVVKTRGARNEDVATGRRTARAARDVAWPDRKSTRLNSSHVKISYA